jgi:hypothetical protein
MVIYDENRSKTSIISSETFLVFLQNQFLCYVVEHQRTHLGFHPPKYLSLFFGLHSHPHPLLSSIAR